MILVNRRLLRLCSALSEQCSHGTRFVLLLLLPLAHILPLSRVWGQGLGLGRHNGPVIQLSP